ncbi:MAG: hypothetical protein ACRENP_26405 [Longimicrobiales bacterium]
MYALRDAAGEDGLNLALSRFLSRAAVGEPPYSTTAELLAAVRPVVPEESEHLVEDLFENITTFDNEVTAATSTERADGTFLVRPYYKLIDRDRGDNVRAVLPAGAQVRQR